MTPTSDAAFLALVRNPPGDPAGAPWSLWLVSGLGVDAERVEVSGQDFGTFDGELVQSTVGRKELGPLPAGDRVLVEHRDDWVFDFNSTYDCTLHLVDGTTRRFAFTVWKDAPSRPPREIDGLGSAVVIRGG